MDWLVAREAIATVEAANLLAESVDDPTKLADAQEKAVEAQDYARLIALIGQARTPEFPFERCEIKQPIPINPQTTT